MAASARQRDLFDEPQAPDPPDRPLRPPYTLAELTELDHQLKQFARLPDEWCPGWVDIMERAYDTLKQVPRDQRELYRAVFFDEAERMYRVESEEVRQAEEAKRKQEAESKRRRKRPATA